ncbi:MAG: hypothetical protein IPN90_04240 [Elusimicrobia bacterium]|nr:hypothetical protein [Elusimicrobiota bacterium]
MSPVIEGIVFLESWLPNVGESLLSGAAIDFGVVGQMGVVVGLFFALAHVAVELSARYLNAGGGRAGWNAVFSRGALVQDTAEFGNRLALFGAGLAIFLGVSSLAGPFAASMITTLAHSAYNIGTLPKGWFKTIWGHVEAGF